jgi:transcriptional regulator with XRE-family HTH domain
MPTPTPVRPEQLARFRELIASAAEGTAPWLDGLLREGGYVRLDQGVSQADLVRECGVTKQLLLDWELDGLPAVKDGRSKRYPILTLIGWMKKKFVRPGRPRTGDTDQWDQRNRAASARLKEVALDKETKTLITRDEAEATMASMYGEVRSSLFAMVSQLASQLEHRDAPAIRQIMNQHVTHICRQMAKGRVPDTLQRELDAALERYSRRLPK